MLVKDIILKACDFIGNEELSQALVSEEELTDEQSAELDTLLKCFNLVHNEIVSEYKPSIKIERVTSANKKINFSQLSAKVVNILAVKDILGDNVAFKVFDSYLMVEGGEVDVWYSSQPETMALSDEFVSTIPERVYAYGIAREYYFIQTLYEDAEVWESRFKNSLQVIERKKSETVIPRRRWL